MKATHPVLFREVQRFRDVWWVMALVFGVAALQWYIFLGQIIGGARAASRQREERHEGEEQESGEHPRV